MNDNAFPIQIQEPLMKSAIFWCFIEIRIRASKRENRENRRQRQGRESDGLG